jgi:hypothetical protein
MRVCSLLLRPAIELVRGFLLPLLHLRLHRLLLKMPTLVAARSRAKPPQMFANVEWAAGVHRAAEEALKPWTALSCKPSCFTVDHSSACFSSHATGFQLGAAVSAEVPLCA